MFSKPCMENLIPKDTHLVFSMYVVFLIVVPLNACLCFQDQQPDERRILVPKESKNLFRVRLWNTCGTVLKIQTSMTIPLLMGIRCDHVNG